MVIKLLVFIRELSLNPPNHKQNTIFVILFKEAVNINNFNNQINF